MACTEPQIGWVRVTYSATAAGAFKDAFYGVAQTLFATDNQVLVSFGHPGLATNDDMILFLGVKSQQAEAAMSSSLRSRWETLELDLFISSYRAGEQDNDKVPSDRVYSLLGQLENYVRTTDTTLGIGLQQCFLTSHDSTGSTDPQVLARGRMVDCTATFTALVRITN
jgi:hypothetical protein